MSNSLKYQIMIIFLIFMMIAFILLLAVSKRFELQEPDCTHFEDFLKQIKKVSNVSKSEDILA